MSVQTGSCRLQEPWETQTSPSRRPGGCWPSRPGPREAVGPGRGPQDGAARAEGVSTGGRQGLQAWSAAHSAGAPSAGTHLRRVKAKTRAVLGTDSPPGRRPGGQPSAHSSLLRVQAAARGRCAGSAWGGEVPWRGPLRLKEGTKQTRGDGRAHAPRKATQRCPLLINLKDNEL